MAENENLDSRTGEESTTNMAMGDGNENCANGDYDLDNYDRDDADEDSDKDLSDTLSRMASRLCSICCNFPKGRFKAHPDYSTQETLKLYHNSLLSLQESVDRGCPLCLDLSKGLKRRLEESQRFQRDMDQSPSIWCRIETWRWEEGKHVRGFQMVFCLCCRDGRPLSDWPDVPLAFFPPKVLGVGPEFRGTKPIICLAVVIWTDTHRYCFGKNNGKFYDKHRFGSILAQRMFAPQKLPEMGKDIGSPTNAPSSGSDAWSRFLVRNCCQSLRNERSFTCCGMSVYNT